VKTDLVRKSGPATFKDEGGKGEFSAAFSVIGNVDHDGDRILSGAFDKAMEGNPNPAIVWTHRWDVPPIGETFDWSEKDDLVVARGRVFADDHEVARQVYVGMKSGALRQFSWSGRLAKDGYVEPDDEARVSADHLMDIVALEELWEWGPTLIGANPETAVLSSPKSLGAMLGLSGKSVDSLIAQHLATLKRGARNSAKDAERLQAIHDLAVENGAACKDTSSEEDDDDPGKSREGAAPDPVEVSELVYAVPRFAHL
jgi:HK97 family phage prohead protease